MNFNTEIKEIIQKVGSYLPEEDLEIANEFFSRQELHLALEYICDELIDNETAIPEELSKQIQGLVEEMGISQERTWDSLMVWKDNPKKTWILTTGKDYLIVYEKLSKIYQKIRGKISAEDREWTEEYLSHGEYELALDIICAALIEYKTPITRTFLKEIKDLLTDMSRPSDTWSGFNVTDA
jgi:hypothetical protein